MQLAPSFPLQSIVRHYLILSNEAGAHPDFRMFSDGSPGIVFHRKCPLLQQNETEQHTLQPESFVYGQITHFTTLSATAAVDMLIVVLQPGAVFRLFGIPAFELNDLTVPFTALTGNAGLVLMEQVQQLSDNIAAITAIESFLLSRLHQDTYDGQLIDTTLQQIYTEKGQSTIATLLKAIPVTERQLERKFRQHIGLSPKKFADIIRFQHFLKNLRQCAATVSLSELSFTSGYYDQSHLNNSFKKFTGLTPGQYQADVQQLAVNFLLLS